LPCSASLPFDPKSNSPTLRRHLAAMRLIDDITEKINDVDDDLFDIGIDYMEEGNFAEAEKCFIQLSDNQKHHWDGPESLAEIYLKTGNSEKAIENIKEALRRIQEGWKTEPDYIDYEVFEEIEHLADKILDRSAEEIAARYSDYVFGLLYDIGAVSIDDLYEYFKEDCYESLRTLVSRNVFIGVLSGDKRFGMKGDCLYLSSINNIDTLLDERARRNIDKVVFRYSLSYAKLVQEGRYKQALGEDESEIDDLLTELIHGRWNYFSVRKLIRHDIKDQANFNRIASDIVELPERDTILKLLNDIWNSSPRWELGGGSPEEMSKTNNKAKR